VRRSAVKLLSKDEGLMSHSRTRDMLIALPTNNLLNSGHGRLRGHARVAVFSPSGSSSRQIIRSLQDSAISSHERLSSASNDLVAMHWHIAKLTR
jgi:hypothetical protein